MKMRYKEIEGEVYYKLFEDKSDWGTDNPFPLLKGRIDGYDVKEFKGVEPSKKKAPKKKAK